MFEMGKEFKMILTSCRSPIFRAFEKIERGGTLDTFSSDARHAKLKQEAHQKQKVQAKVTFAKRKESFDSCEKGSYSFCFRESYLRTKRRIRFLVPAEPIISWREQEEPKILANAS